jgi:hypothetical protein
MMLIINVTHGAMDPGAPSNIEFSFAVDRAGFSGLHRRCQRQQGPRSNRSFESRFDIHFGLSLIFIL